EMLLFGYNVTIDQVKNTAIVEGAGALSMPSNKTLDGKPKESQLTIHWTKSMWFNGRSADFDGDVQALQDSGKLRCHHMQCTLDKPVDFKQGQRGGEKSSVDKIVCDGREDQPVWVY